MKFVLVIFIFILITAGFGVTLLSFLLKGKVRPNVLVGIKGIFAGATLSLITVFGALHAGQQNFWFNTSFALFWVGGFIGVYMLVKDKVFPTKPSWAKEFPVGGAIPKSVAFAHAGTQITALIFFIIYVVTTY